MAYVLGWRDAVKLAVVADAWVAARGPVFAARATAEVAGLWVNEGKSPAVRRTTGRDHAFGWLYRWQPIPERTRVHLAAATDAEYQEAVVALSGFRGGTLRQRVVSSYLLPTERVWVDDDITELQQTSSLNHVEELTVCTLASVEQLDRLGDKVVPWSVARSTGVLATLLEGVGPPIAPRVAAWFDGYGDSDMKKRLVAMLAAIPTDEAFQLLLDRLDQKHVQPAVLDAMSRYPVRAVRLLATAAGGQSAAARVAAEVLRVHMVGSPAAVAAALPSLPAEARARVESITTASSVVPEAPADLLPPILVTPPWTGPRRQPKPVVVDGLHRPHEATVVWRPGEREAWAAHRPVDTWHGKRSWEELAAEHRRGALAYYEQVALMADGPEELVRPLLAEWRPTDAWYASAWADRLVAKYELAALPALLHLATKSAPNMAGTLLPYGVTEVADLMADCLARLKSVRAVALAWLDRHPAVAARALVPAALGKPGPARRAAETALRLVATGGHHAEVTAAAAGYGEAAAKAVAALVGVDPVDLLPARIPAVPDWADPSLLPPVLLRDRTHALPRTAAGHLLTMLAMSRPGEVYAGVVTVQEACDPASLAAFGWAVFERWRAVGTPAKEGWALDALGWLGNDETVRRLAPLIRAWPGEGGHSRAVSGLDVLAGIGTDVALMHLHGIAEKVKFKALKERAQEKIADVAADLGLQPEQLADRLVPDLGLDAGGSLALDYGPRQFTVGFDEQLKPYVVDADGKRRGDLPKPGARDDESLATPAYQRFVALKKDVRTIAADQIRRFEQAMVLGRRWTGREFADLFVGHPLLWHVVRRLVWATFDDAGTVHTALRLAEDRTVADVHDDTVTVADDAQVGIAHPLHLGPDLAAWSELFADYEILQPFPQLGREVHALTDEERAATGLARFTGVKVPTTKVLGLERRGWRRGQPQDAGIQGWMERVVPGGRAVVVDLDPGIVVGMVTEFPEQRLDSVWLNDRPTGGWRPEGVLRFGELDPVTASEVLRDLTEVTS
jgi:hypothetical protein